MNRNKRSAKTNTPVQYSHADDNAAISSNKTSDMRAEYVAPATAERKPALYAQNKTYRNSAAKSEIKPAPLASPSSHYIAGVYCPDEVRQFTLAHALGPHLERALQLVQECFPAVKMIKLAREVDWEVANESWIAINIQAPGKADQVLEEYLRFNRRMVQELPADKSAKILLGLTHLRKLKNLLRVSTMMGRDFLQASEHLLKRKAEATLRSAVSLGYYALFMKVAPFFRSRSYTALEEVA